MGNSSFFIKYYIKMIESGQTKAFVMEIASRPTRKNTNFLCVVVGLPGTGKSYSCIRLGQLVTDEINEYNRKHDKPEIEFSMNNVVFTPGDFLRRIHGKDALTPGSVIIFEEVGTSLDSKDALTKLNKMIAHVVETMRYRKYITFFNLPRFMNLDKTIRSLCHCVIETKKIVHHKNFCYIKPLLTQFNPKLDKAYHRYVKFKDGGKQHKATSVKLRKPTTKIRNEYERMKHAFADNLYEGILAEIEPVKETPEQIERKKLLGLTPVQKRVYRHVTDNNIKNPSPALIANMIDSKVNTVAAALARLDKLELYNY